MRGETSVDEGPPSHGLDEQGERLGDLQGVSVLCPILKRGGWIRGEAILLGRERYGAHLGEGRLLPCKIVDGLVCLSAIIPVRQKSDHTDREDRRQHHRDQGAERSCGQVESVGTCLLACARGGQLRLEGGLGEKPGVILDHDMRRARSSQLGGGLWGKAHGRKRASFAPPWSVTRMEPGLSLVRAQGRLFEEVPWESWSSDGK